MKHAVFSLILPEFTFAEQAGLLKKLGYDGIEIRVCDIGPEHAGKPFSNWGNHRDPIGPSNIAARAPELKKIADDAGIEIPALAPYTRVTDPEAFKPLAEAASVLKAGVVRVTAPGYDPKTGFEGPFEASIAGLETIEGIARDAGIKAAIEIHHGTIAPSASGVRRILEGFDPEAVGAIVDPGNMIHEGFENWKLGLDILGPYLAHVHVKNALWVLKDRTEGGPFIWEARWSRLREGIGNWKTLMDALRGAGYESWLSLEDFSDLAIQEKLADDIAFLKSLE